MGQAKPHGSFQLGGFGLYAGAGMGTNFGSSQRGDMAIQAEGRWLYGPSVSIGSGAVNVGVAPGAGFVFGPMWTVGSW